MKTKIILSLTLLLSAYALSGCSTAKDLKGLIIDDMTPIGDIIDLVD